MLLGILGCIALMHFFGRETERRRCPYCGVVKGHRQDCPYDFDQRGLGR